MATVFGLLCGIVVLTCTHSLSTRPISRRSISRHRLFSTYKKVLLVTDVTSKKAEKRSLGVIIAGAPASGKGTQCAFIAEEYGLVHLSTGDLLRAAVAAKSKLGVEAKEYMDSGRLVPDKLVIDLVAEKLKSEECKRRGWLLDGFPRTFAQTQALAAAGADVDAFISLQVPDENLVERVVGRRTDPVTGAIYHLKFDPPPAEVEGRVTQRSDDTEEKVRVRLQQFHAHVTEVSDFYKDVLFVVDGLKSKGTVFQHIKQGLNKAQDRIDGIVEHKTSPIAGMKMGTSGLRKPVSIFSAEERYLKNFVQSIFDALPTKDVVGGTLVLGGDGRYFNRRALQIIFRMAAANGVGAVWVGKGGILATPAASAVIRERDSGKAFGGIILTASHNPGGADGDFGIKYNTADGAPAKEALIDAIHKASTVIQRFKIVEGGDDVDLDRVGSTTFVGRMPVTVIDSIEDYSAILKKCFDFPRLRSFLSRRDFSMVLDGMHGAGGPYAHRILVEDLGLMQSSLTNCVPKEDFGGLHPDPNLVYATDFIKSMGLTKGGKQAPGSAKTPDFGAALDGDADRNMICGSRFFVNPSDSLALIAANAHVIPQFASGLGGVARSMPTSQAVDAVAEALDVECFETPTGWKYFGNLMDLEDGEFTPFLCGEESFGTGASHIREKDGLWAVLAWLSILADANADPQAPLVGVQKIVEKHWRKFGRNYYSRQDYESVDGAAAEQVMEHLRSHFKSLAEAGHKGGIQFGDLLCVDITEFTYLDPVDSSLSLNQGISLTFKDGERAVFRLSGTGSHGATIRLYLERHEVRPDSLGESTESVLKKVAEAAQIASQITNFIGKVNPDVAT